MSQESGKFILPFNSNALALANYLGPPSQLDTDSQFGAGILEDIAIQPATSPGR